jgi:hypothetical protein
MIWDVAYWGSNVQVCIVEKSAISGISEIIGDRGEIIIDCGEII